MRMWTALRETHGVMLPSSDALAKLISAQPDLRGYTAPELAARLSIPLEVARAGIQTFAKETFGPVKGACPDMSFDELTVLAGTYHAPVELVTGPGGAMRTEPIPDRAPHLFANVMRRR